MAYTNAPEQQPYRPFPVEFDATTTYRSGNLSVQRDSNIRNMYFDRISQENKQREVFLKKRPGLRTTAYDLTRAVSTDGIRGFFNDVTANAMYWATGNKVYRADPDAGTSIRTVATLTTLTGQVGFCEFLVAATNTRYIIISDGTDLWVDNYAASSCNKVTDPDLPTPHRPHPRQINGYLLLAKTSTGDIYNSNNDDPTAWTAGEYITAEALGDFVTRIEYNRNYLVAFGRSSMEIFWDAANETGSPLKRNESGYKNVGYSNGMCQIGNVLFFVGQDQNQSLAVYKLDGFKLDRISNEIVERTLQPITTTDNNAAPVNTRDGYCIAVDGHTFYVFVTQQTTWAYDIEEKMWYEWRDSDDGPLEIQAAWGQWEGSQYVAIAEQQYISMFSPYVYQDFGTNFACVYTTERISANTQNYKFCHRMLVRADNDSNGTSNLIVSWSDDDWKSTASTTTVNLFDTSPWIHRLGRFRNRSFRFTYSDNYPLRLRGIELELAIGTH